MKQPKRGFKFWALTALDVTTAIYFLVFAVKGWGNVGVVYVGACVMAAFTMANFALDREIAWLDARIKELEDEIGRAP